MAVPSAITSDFISLFASILSSRAFATVNIVPRRGRIACVLLSLPCLPLLCTKTPDARAKLCVSGTSISYTSIFSLSVVISFILWLKCIAASFIFFSSPPKNLPHTVSYRIRLLSFNAFRSSLYASVLIACFFSYKSCIAPNALLRYVWLYVFFLFSLNSGVHCFFVSSLRHTRKSSSCHCFFESFESSVFLSGCDSKNSLTRFACAFLFFSFAQYAACALLSASLFASRYSECE